MMGRENDGQESASVFEIVCMRGSLYCSLFTDAMHVAYMLLQSAFLATSTKCLGRTHIHCVNAVLQTLSEPNFS